jgi:hypothetical protein
MSKDALESAKKKAVGYQPDHVKALEDRGFRRLIQGRLGQSDRKFEMLEPLEDFPETSDLRPVLEFISKYIISIEGLTAQDGKSFSELPAVHKFNKLTELGVLERTPLIVAALWFYTSANEIIIEKFFR